MDLGASCGWEKKRHLVGAHVHEQLMYMNIQLLPKERSPSGNSINSHEHQCFKAPGWLTTHGRGGQLRQVGVCPAWVWKHRGCFGNLSHGVFILWSIQQSRHFVANIPRAWERSLADCGRMKGWNSADKPLPPSPFVRICSWCWHCHNGGNAGNDRWNLVHLNFNQQLL